jgi:hypothetical protein
MKSITRQAPAARNQGHHRAAALNTQIVQAVVNREFCGRRRNPNNGGNAIELTHRLP